MSYDKVLVDLNGEEFPYSESFDSETYYYAISVVFDNRDGELLILRWGAHLIFDDDLSWLDFNLSPEEIFPARNQLSKSEILEFMQLCLENESNAKLYTKKEMDVQYQRFLKLAE
ncbi:hypothetical protein [Photobacterium sp. J15]|uniref:hypothetical protein n=1 Tax=Photobacterium sp. J15 TaxID=265901 RepID=UPI0007E350EC|nr:hypothetical protein [Photobacterium sp. J15]